MRIWSKVGFTILIVGGIRTFASCQPLASGQWSKFSVTADGIFKIDYNLLKKAGFNPDQINPKNIQLFSNGTGMLPQPNAASRQNKLTEIAILIDGESDGKFDKNDVVLFFGQGPDEYHFDIPSASFAYSNNLYSDKNFYFLTVASTPGKRIADLGSQPGTFPVIDTYNDFGYYKPEKTNILSSGREWFGDQLNSNAATLSLPFDLPGIVENSPIIFASHVMAQAFESKSAFRVSVNGVQIIQQDIDAVDDSQYAVKGMEKIDTVAITASQVGAAAKSSQVITYQFIPATSGYSAGYLDFFIFSIERKLSYNKETIFTSVKSVSNPVSTFSVSDLPAAGTVWDITDAMNIKNLQCTFTSDHSSFSIKTDSLKKFIAFTSGDAISAAFEGAVPNQDLASLSAPDLLIITHPDFQTEAVRLANFRKNQNRLSTQVVTVQQIYNEYSGGKQDVTALRDFVKDISSRAGSGLDNLLLFGRCSYDYKNLNPVLINTNYVPTYESRNSLSPLETYSSDDYFGFLEVSEGEWPESPAQDYTMDIGVGRISVVSIQQAQAVVDKLIDYETNADRFGEWRKNIVFVADDGDFNIHQSQADGLATNIDTAHSEFNTKKIYLDQFKQIMKPSGQFSPDARDALTRLLDDGSMLVNYTGHGSENVWAQEQILDRQLVLGLRNAPRYPLFVTATCEFGRHDDPFQISSGELLLFQPGGGAIGLVTTARPVNSGTNYELNQSFYEALFKKTNGAYRDMGTVFRDTKNNSQSGVANRNFSLIGDPSLHLALTGNTVVLTSVKTSASPDALEGLSTVMIEGEVQQNGTRISSFNGEANLTVIDRPLLYTTKGDENPPFIYHQLSNALFRGNVPVSSGAFSVRFIMPGTIETSVGAGKITTYAFSGSVDASGDATTIVGGLETPSPLPNAGPSMNLFIGDTTFINGGIASPNTRLVIKFHAANGINISEAGGEGLKVILDDTLSYDVNPYYTATSGDSIGTVSYPLLDLAPGKHGVVVTAFDTFGKETQAAVSFIVTDKNLHISSFYNFPNPFSSSGTTTFIFSHNRPGEDLDVNLSITDLAGREVASREFSIAESLTEVTLAGWDGTAFAGNKISTGVYIAKLSVRSLLDGSKNHQFARLIIVN